MEKITNDLWIFEKNKIKDIKFFKLSEPEQNKVLSSLLNLFHNVQLTDLLILSINKANLDETSFDLIDYLLAIPFTSNPLSPTIQERVFELLQFLARNMANRRIYIAKLLELISSNLSAIDTCDLLTRKCDEIIHSLNLLLATYRKQSNMFISFLETNNGLSITKQIPWSFNKGFSFATWIYLPCYSTMKTEKGVIFQLRGSQVVLECVLAGDMILYSITVNDVKTELEAGRIKVNCWMFIGIVNNFSSNPSSVYLVVGDNEELKNVTLDFKETSTEEFSFFKNCTVASKGILLYNSALLVSQLGKIKKTFSESSLELNLMDDSIESDLYLFYHPKYIYKKTAFNVVKNFVDLNTTINDTIIPIIPDKECITKLENILPYINLATLISGVNGGIILNKVLNFVNNYLKQREYNVRVKHEIRDLVSVLGYHLSYMDPKMITQETLDYLRSIMVHADYIKCEVIKMLMNTINLWANTSTSVYSYYWEILRDECSANPNSKLTMELVLSMMENLEPSYKENSCCQKSMNRCYSPMKSFIFNCIVTQSPKDIVNMFICVLYKHPSHCLFLAITDLLFGLINKVSSFAKEFYLSQGQKALFKLVKNYRMDVKMACVRILTALSSLGKVNIINVEKDTKSFIQPVFSAFKQITNKTGFDLKTSSFIIKDNQETKRLPSLMKKLAQSFKDQDKSSIKIYDFDKTEATNVKEQSFDSIKEDYTQLYNYLVFWTLGLKLDDLIYGCDSLKKTIHLEDKSYVNSLRIVNLEPICLMCYIEKKINSFEFTYRLIKDVAILYKASPENEEKLVSQGYFLMWMIEKYQQSYIKLYESPILTLTKEILTNLILKRIQDDSNVFTLLRSIAYSKEIAIAKDKLTPNVPAIVKAELSIWGSIISNYRLRLAKCRPINAKSTIWKNLPVTIIMTIKQILINFRDKENNIKILELVDQMFILFGNLCGEESVNLKDLNVELKKKLEFVVSQGKQGELFEALQILALESKAKEDDECRFSGKPINIIQLITIFLNNSISKCYDCFKLNYWIGHAKSTMSWFIFLAEYAKVVGDSSLMKDFSNGFLVIVSNILRKLISSESTENVEFNNTMTSSITNTLRFLFSLALKTPDGNAAKLSKMYELQPDKWINNSDIELLNNIKKLYNSNDKLKKAASSFDGAIELILKTIKAHINTYIKRKANDNKIYDDKYLYYYTIIRRISKTYASKFSENRANVLSNMAQQVSFWQIRCEYKWKCIQKRLKQWRGGWRNNTQFKVITRLEVTRLPQKLSNHFFDNGARCVMTLRTKRIKLLDKKQYPTCFEENFIPEKSFIQMRRITCIPTNVFHIPTNSLQPIVTAKLSYEDVINLIYYRMSKSQRESLPLPTSCEIYTNLYLKKGSFILYLKSTTKGYIIFVVKEKVPLEVSRVDKGEYTPLESKKFSIKKIKLSSIKSIVRKWLVNAETAIEITCWTGKSILFNFSQEVYCKKICSKLLKLKKQYCPYLKYSSCNPLKILTKLSLTMDWVNCKCSTFDYLLHLNNMSSRSFNNLSQYPIFPWTLSDYGSDKLKLDDSKIYRNLTKNIGMIGNPTRAEEFKQKFYYEDLTGQGHFNFGSHYSTPAIVYQFLMRLYPIFESYVGFFKGLDIPNRMFHSMRQAWESTQTDTGNVRELIPELFSLPEALVNNGHILFGTREDDNEKVDNVCLPGWAKEDHCYFVEMMRESLESPHVSKYLPAWIDLIFGYKQRGKEAEKAFNVYPALCYDANKIISEAKDEQVKNDLKLQAFDWGQVPQQLFTQKHPERSSKNYTICDEYTKLTVYPKRNIEEVKTLDIEDSIVYIKVIGKSTLNSKFICIALNGKIIEDSLSEITEKIKASTKPKIVPNTLKVTSKSYSSSFSRIVSRRNISSETYPNYPIIVLNKHTPSVIVQAGKLDGSILITSLSNTKKQVTMNICQFTITTLTADRKERILIIGNCIGEIYLLSIEDDMKFLLKKVLWDHIDRVNSINISKAMNMFASAGDDGCINIYSFGDNPKLLRSIYNKSGNSFNFVLSLFKD